MITGCMEHTKTGLTPSTRCDVCKRIGIEIAIVTRVVDALLAAGYYLNIDTSGDGYELPACSRDRAAILAAMIETDDENLVVFKDDGCGKARIGFVCLVYGNDGSDTINDYTLNLEDVLQPVINYADSL